MSDKVRVENILDKLMPVHDRMIRAEIDASCCQTRFDRDRFCEAQEDFDVALIAAIRDLVSLIKHGGKT